MITVRPDATLAEKLEASQELVATLSDTFVGPEAADDPVTPEETAAYYVGMGFVCSAIAYYVQGDEEGGDTNLNAASLYFIAVDLVSMIAGMTL